MSLNSVTGSISGIPDLVSGDSSVFTLRVRDAGNPSGFREKEFAIWVVAPLGITTDIIEQGLQKTLFTAEFKGEGGILPYTWSIAQGSLPQGMALDPETGTLTGTPTQCGMFEFTVQLQDSAIIFDSITRAFQMEILCCNDYEITGSIGDLEGVIITLGGDDSGITTTDAQGNFRFANLAVGSYTLTPSLAGYKFEPSAIDITDLKMDLAELDFVEQVNHPPDEASSPGPADNAVNIGLNADLIWSGSDPDAGDTLVYDVYFGTLPEPGLVNANQSGTGFEPGALTPNTKYYWKIVIKDNYGMEKQGPVWRFTTMPEKIQFKTDAYFITEDEGVASITLTRTNGSHGEVSVILEANDGSAVSGEDYTFISGKVVFVHGETEKTIDVLIVNDGRLEGDETVHLNLVDPSGGAVLGKPDSAILTIQDGSMDVLAGDVNGSGNVDLLDLLMTLKVMAGEPPGSDVCLNADIDGDGKIGLKEAVYILQEITDQTNQD